jgi:uncharacterized protein YhaN
VRFAELRAARDAVPAPVPRRPLLTAGVAIAAAAMLVAAIVVGSLALGAAGVVAALAGWWTATSHGRGRPLASEPRDLAELRLELAERQALAQRARSSHREAAVRAGRGEAILAERMGALPPKADVEEALAEAQEQLRRVRELEQTLDHAIRFLRRAQERVHREVVPELTGLLREWLPSVTDERYVDVRMDPATLAVEVCGPTREFQRAELLSHGTAEQIYLLLRVALAALLTEGHDTCPLLLDDVTVHADPERTRRILELLHRLSGERQIVLFAHQEQVREWAYARFDGERDALVELQPLGVSSLTPV